MTALVEPIDLCLESLDAAEDERPYVRCVALTGSLSGLGVDADGAMTWQTDAAAVALL